MPVCLWSGAGRVSSTAAGPQWGPPARGTPGPGWPGPCRPTDAAWCSTADWQAGQSVSCLSMWAERNRGRKKSRILWNFAFLEFPKFFRHKRTFVSVYCGQVFTLLIWMLSSCCCHCMMFSMRCTQMLMFPTRTDLPMSWTSPHSEM